jgi:predicted TIM-barrel fold metal-dependent hydrolase
MFISLPYLLYSMKKIDIHCHTTDRKVRDVIPESCTIDAITEEMHEHDVEQTVVLASYFPHKGSGISNFRLYDWIRDRRGFAMFGSLDFDTFFYQGMNELEELAGREVIKGIKVYTGYQLVDLRSKNFSQLTDLASDLAFVADKGINVIASHMAKPHFSDLIDTLQRVPNMYTDVSGLIDSKFDRTEIDMTVWTINKFLEEVGSSKLLFGTDFPVQTHKDSIYFVEQGMKGFSDAEKEDVYYNNARRLLR